MSEFPVRDTAGFCYGINLSRSSDSIADGEAVELHNWEFEPEDGALSTVPGLKPLFHALADITSLYFDRVNNVFYYTSEQKLFRTDNLNTKGTEIGLLSGTDKPTYATFGATLLVASGGILQYVSNKGQLFEIEGGPEATSICVSNGRVVCYHHGSPEIKYSAVGDCFSWVIDKEHLQDRSQAQYIGVGYKDPSNIVAVDFLSKVMLVYQENGRAYKVISSPDQDDFAVEPVSMTAYCSSQHATCSIDDKSYYIGQDGFKSFRPTTAFGDIAPFDEGLAVNSVLSQQVTQNARIWHVTSRQQLWISPGDGTSIYLYHYLPRLQDGRGAFTTRSFFYPVHDVIDVAGKVYVACGKTVAILDSTIDTDCGTQIRASIIGPDRLASKHSILVMNRLLVTDNKIPGYMTLKAGKKTRQIKIGTSDPTIYSLWSDDIVLHTEPIFRESKTRDYKVGGGSNKEVQLVLTVEKGAVSLRNLSYEYLEV